MIKTVNIDYNNVISASTKPLERQDLNVNPLSAAEADAHTVVETIFQPNDPDRVILTIGAISGGVNAFTIGETISANNSGATAVVVSVKLGKLTAKSVNGIFNTTDTISGGTSTSTSPISAIEELWND